MGGEAVASDAVGVVAEAGLDDVEERLAALSRGGGDARLRRATRLEQRLEAKTAPLLRVVTSSEYLWRDAYQSRDAFVQERLGMSPRKARSLLRLERVGDCCPALREAYRDGALSWVQANPERVARGSDDEPTHSEGGPHRERQI